MTIDNLVCLKTFKEDKEKQKDPFWTVCKTYIDSMNPEVNPEMRKLAEIQFEEAVKWVNSKCGTHISQEYMAEVERAAKEAGYNLK